VITITSELKNPAAIYLRGLILLIDKKPEQALVTFDRLATDDIPPPFLYPPYRLYRYFKPQESNRYLISLRKAIDENRVPPLIQARVQAQEGDLQSAISSYLKTDPAKWGLFDTECLKIIGAHSGLHSEVRRMIAGALKSRRVPEPMAKELLAVANLQSKKSDVDELKRKLGQELKRNGNSAKIAVTSITRMLETRKLFLQRDYKSILKKYELAQPVALTTETVLLLFLSAVKLDNRIEMYRWGQEIKRRYPNRETLNWVNSMTGKAP